MESNIEKPVYRSKIEETFLDEPQIEQVLPEKIVPTEFDENESGLGILWLLVLGLGVLSVLSFSVFHAIETITAYFNDYPILTGFLSVLLGAFLLMLLFLIYKEVKGYFDVVNFVQTKINITELEELDDQTSTITALKQLALIRSKSSYAHHCYSKFDSSINTDLSNKEILDLYKITVSEPVLRKAEDVLRKESFVSGGLAFISPNTLIQSLLFFWISMRTLKRIARVFGLRSGFAGNWKLIKIVAENMAAQSFFDLATDEVTNQIGGSLAAKFMESSAEAIAAGALNVRLGKALIKLLNENELAKVK